MNKKNIGIQKFLTKHMVFIAFVMFGLLLFIWVMNEYYVFSSKAKLLKEEYEDVQKTMLKNEVNNVVNYIDYMKDQTERRLKSELKGRVNEAIDIARNIYQENIDSKQLFEIEKMIKDALRPIRFLEGRGYYFAFSMDGIETLFADRPEMEGKNMLPVQGAKGEYVVRDMIDIVKKQREGFYKYTWTKPSQKEKGFLKIAYVKYFKSLDWVFGTGEYLDDFTNQIQNMVLDRIVGLRFSDEGYFFGSREGGYPLFTNGKVTKNADSIGEMTDPNGVKIIQEQQRISKHPNGGFVRYSWPKLGSSVPVAKISYVREISEWGWTIGAGVYLDSVDKKIAKSKDTLKRELIEKSVMSICVFIGFIGVIWFWAKRVASKTQETIETFETSFKKAATASAAVPVDDMQFSELSRIAESANKMIDLQKKTENSLRESEEKFRQLIENINEIFWIRDAKTNELLYISPNFEKIWGLSINEVMKKPESFLEAIHPDDRDNVVRVFQNQKEDEQFELEYRIILPDGSVRWIKGKIFPIFNATGDIYRRAGINEDITEKKKMEADLIQAHKMEAIGTLAGGIAHDFNNILSSILGYTELAMDDVDKGSTVEDSLKEVYKAGNRAKDLVWQILTFARQTDDPMKPIQVDTIAKEVLKFIRSSIPTTIDIQQNIASDSLIMGNATQIHQIIMNLCTNAAQAMEESGGILELTLMDVTMDKISPLVNYGLKPGDYIELTVSDTGLGIPQDVIHSIFEPYFTTKAPGEGSGMGLAVVQGIVEQRGGKINVYSQLGEGTAFRVYLPITKKRRVSESFETQVLPPGTERILLVDDEAPIAQMGSQILERLGYTVTKRTSSIEALELFKQKPDKFDLVISDTTMPNMTGDILSTELMAIRSDIPIILCTGYSKKISDETALEIGVKAFLYKPIVKSELAKTVRNVLDEAKGGTQR